MVYPSNFSLLVHPLLIDFGGGWGIVLVVVVLVVVVVTGGKQSQLLVLCPSLEFDKNLKEKKLTVFSSERFFNPSMLFLSII